jgi:hypothetical protein
LEWYTNSLIGGKGTQVGGGTPEAPTELPPPTAPPSLEQLEGQAQGRGKRRKITKKPFEYSIPR